MIRCLFVVIVLSSLLPLFIQGASLDIVINEVCWMGTENSANDEWIELYNNTGNTVNLEGWVLKADDGSPEINLEGIIPANGFYLLERTDDDSASGITANQIYTGPLKNSGEKLKLYDNSKNLIDELDCSEGWFAGDNKTKQTMERKSPLSGSGLNNWRTSQDPGGTPKTKNSLGLQPAEDGPPRNAEVKPSQIHYPVGLVFNELLPSPEGPDAEEEWIEIFNQNNFEVDISGWKIKDSEGRAVTYIFPTDTKISPKSYLVLQRPETKITLNNTNDGLNLIQPNGEITDSLTYEKAPRGQSYNRTESGWFWSSSLTPGTRNIVSTPKQRKTISGSPQAISQREELPAAAKKAFDLLDRDVPKKSPSTFLIALIVAIFSGMAILILKKKTTPL